MVKFRHLLTALIICLNLATVCALAQSSFTQIRDTVVNPDGTPFNGTVLITWNGYSVPGGTPVSQLSASARIYNGALSVLLVPTTTAASGTYYQVVYNSSDGTVTWSETWQVPPSTTALTLSQVRQSTTEGSGGGGGSSGSGGYATLPIAISQVTGLSSSLSSLNGSIASLTTQVAALGSTSITALTNTVNALSNTVTGLSSTVTGNTNSIGTLTSTVTGLSTTVSGNSNSVASLTTSVASLNTTVAGILTTLSGLGSGSITAAFVDASIPTGTINGTNAVFGLASAPSPASSLALYRNGLLQSAGVDYTLSGSSVTFLTASIPQSGDGVRAYYRGTGSGTAATIIDSEAPTGSINGTNLVFALANAPNPAASLKLYKNGLLMSQNGDYTISGTSVTFAAGAVPIAADVLLAAYRH